MPQVNHLMETLSHYCQRIEVPLARFALFVIYGWFGLLKLIGQSPANPLVSDLLDRTLPMVTFDQFIIGLGLGEVLIGVLFLSRRADRVAVVLFAVHMVTTFMPLILLPQIAWSSPFVPTLEGQYIIKNLALIGLVATIVARLYPTTPSPTTRPQS